VAIASAAWPGEAGRHHQFGSNGTAFASGVAMAVRGFQAGLVQVLV
jgi:hypothetical protein